MEKETIVSETEPVPEKEPVMAPESIELIVTDKDFSDFRSLDQAIRVRTGLDFNGNVTNMLNRVHNGKDVVFVKAEPTFEKKVVKRGFKGNRVYLKMDHWFLIVDDDKREILVVLSDGTTTFRNDRAKIKRSEGVDQFGFKPEIEAEVMKLDPKYKHYTMKHINLLVFPSKMSGALRRKNKEAKAIRSFCVMVNHGLSSFRTAGRCHQIDAAMTIDEMEAVIKEISTNKFRYSFDVNSFANAWKNLYNTFEYLPPRVLDVENATEYKDHLLYCLDVHANDYDKEELDVFAAECGIPKWRKTSTNKLKLRIIKGYIRDNF